MMTMVEIKREKSRRDCKQRVANKASKILNGLLPWLCSFVEVLRCTLQLLTYIELQLSDVHVCAPSFVAVSEKVLSI